MNGIKYILLLWRSQT